MIKKPSRKLLEKELDRYYLELMRNYEAKGIDWRETQDQRQIQHSLNRSVYTTNIKIEAQDGKE